MEIKTTNEIIENNRNYDVVDLICLQEIREKENKQLEDYKKESLQLKNKKEEHNNKKWVSLESQQQFITELKFLFARVVGSKKEFIEYRINEFSDRWAEVLEELE